MSHEQSVECTRHLECQNYLKLQDVWKRLSLAQSLKTVATVALNCIKSELKLDKHLLSLGLDKQERREFVSVGLSEEELTRHANGEYVEKLQYNIDLWACGNIVGNIIIFHRFIPNAIQSHFLGLFAEAVGCRLQGVWNSELRLRKSIRDTMDQEVASIRSINSELQEAIEARSNFLSQMSHEIRTPLNVIIGISDLLLEAGLPKEYSDSVATIHRSGNGLLHLVNDILNLSKLRANNMQLDIHTFDLYEMIDEVEDLFSARNVESVALSCHIDSSVYRYRVSDGDRLRQVIINIMGNAFKFTKEGSISLHVADAGNSKVIFSVLDSGIGIPDNKKKSVFEEFSQVDSGISRKYGGTGLGLAICKKIVELMGGNIWFEDNDKLGRGAACYFQVVIPEASDGVQYCRQLKKPPQIFDEDLLLEPLSILVVDDAPDNLILLKGVFKKTKFVCTYATNGREAVDLFRQQPFDMVLMDLQMPELDGIDAVREMRKMEKEFKRPRTPCIALTADAYNNDLAMLQKEGFDHKLTKPIRKETLFFECCKVIENLRY